MALIIGTDEAGYGPNLGPLVVGGSMWQVPDALADSCMFESLQSVFHCAGRGGKIPVDEIEKRIVVGDSKQLYQSRGSLAPLERSVLTMLDVGGFYPNDLSDLFQKVASLSSLQLVTQATYAWQDVVVPAECQRPAIESLSQCIKNGLDQKEVCFDSLIAAVVFPESFNQGLVDFGNKASLLGTVTCRLIRGLLDQAFENPDYQLEKNVTIICDKHGGRAYYAGMLQQEMTDSFIRVVSESREQSCYRWEEAGRTINIYFIAKGERRLPVALASMIAKYLRELAMEAWNRFWQKKIPALTATAGYPQDAKRFKKQIQKTQRQLNVDDHVIWRLK